MATYTLVDDKGNPVNLIVVDLEEEDYPLPEGYTLQPPSAWNSAQPSGESN